MTSDGVDLIHKNDAGSALLRLLKHVTNAGRTYAYKHLDEVGARNREERHFSLARDRFGEQRLASPRRSHQQHTAWNSTSQLLKLLRILQKVDQLLDFFLGFIAARDVGKGRRVVSVVKHASFALAKTESAALAAALHLAHEIDPYAYQQQNRTPGRQHSQQK